MTRLALVIPHYRQTAFLAECLESVLSPSRPPDEVVVVDSSSDQTSDVLRPFLGRITHLVQPASGVAAARNAGIRATTSDLVAFLDADNLATPDRFERQIQAFEANPGLVLSHGALIPIDRDGTTYEGIDQYVSEPVPIEAQLGWLIERNRVAADTVCVRRSTLETLGGFCEARGVREDYDLWLRMAPTGPFSYIPAPLARYRRHETNLSNDEAYMFEWEAGALLRIDWDTTRRAIRQAYPDETEASVIEGEVRLRRGEHSLAERHFVWLARQGGATGALFHLAHIEISHGMLDNAEALLRRGLREEPDNAALWNNLGVVLARCGERDAALGAFGHAADLRPTYEDARQNLERLLAGRSQADAWRVTRRRLRPQLMPLAAHA